IKTALAVGAAAVLLGAFLYHEIKKPSRGYYVYNDDILYYQDDYWYYFDEAYDDWHYYDAPEDEGWYEDAYYGSDYPFEDGADAFDRSEYYREPSSDSDSDSSVFDSWDSFDTDWSSDW
ncbi:MAG: hypothetical protein IJ048_05285, partial [Clostridia bacterium]|nr:hypothetical protein [Clostridia bacterium]